MSSVCPAAGYQAEMPFEQIGCADAQRCAIESEGAGPNAATSARSVGPCLIWDHTRSSTSFPLLLAPQKYLEFDQAVEIELGNGLVLFTMVRFASAVHLSHVSRHRETQQPIRNGPAVRERNPQEYCVPRIASHSDETHFFGGISRREIQWAVILEICLSPWLQ
jgi:hypothetical protein